MNKRRRYKAKRRRHVASMQGRLIEIGRILKRDMLGFFNPSPESLAAYRRATETTAAAVQPVDVRGTESTGVPDMSTRDKDSSSSSFFKFGMPKDAQA